LDLQCRELQTELDRITERYNKNTTKVFAGLSKIDEEKQYAFYGNTGISLERLCTNFKNYLAYTKKFYYSDVHIRTFIAGFAASKLIILEGMSGTGKSSLPREFGEYIGCNTKRIPVQSSWKDRNDLLGFYNDFEKRYKETEFLKAIYTAIKDKNNIHCILLDEMNLSRIEYYFADLLSVLEEPKPEDWKINLIADAASIKGELPAYIQDGELLLTENLWFVGTANKDDSTFTITDKVYDRAIILDFKERAQEPRNILQQYKNINLNFYEFQSLINNAVKCCSKDEEEKIDKYINALDSWMKLYFEISFGNRISSQIKKFVPAYKNCGGTIEEAIDIIFSTKVIRKIQGYDEPTKNGLNDLLKELRKEYPSVFNFSEIIINNLIDRIGNAS
jgi:MoxR-like ATPase